MEGTTGLHADLDKLSRNRHFGAESVPALARPCCSKDKDVPNPRNSHHIGGDSLSQSQHQIGHPTVLPAHSPARQFHTASELPFPCMESSPLSAGVTQVFGFT